MINLMNKFFGSRSNPKIKQSKFSRFSHDSSSTQKKKIIEKVIKEANKDQRELVEKARKLRTAH